MTCWIAGDLPEDLLYKTQNNIPNIFRRSGGLSGQIHKKSSVLQPYILNLWLDFG